MSFGSFLAVPGGSYQVPFQTFIPTIHGPPTRSDLLGLFYLLLNHELSQLLSEPDWTEEDLPLSQWPAPMVVSDPDVNQLGKLGAIYPGRTFVIITYWGSSVLLAATSEEVTAEVQSHGGEYMQVKKELV